MNETPRPDRAAKARRQQQFNAQARRAEALRQHGWQCVLPCWCTIQDAGTKNEVRILDPECPRHQREEVI